MFLFKNMGDVRRMKKQYSVSELYYQSFVFLKTHFSKVLLSFFMVVATRYALFFVCTLFIHGEWPLIIIHQIIDVIWAPVSLLGVQVYFVNLWADKRPKFSVVFDFIRKYSLLKAYGFSIIFKLLSLVYILFFLFIVNSIKWYIYIPFLIFYFWLSSRLILSPYIFAFTPEQNTTDSFALSYELMSGYVGSIFRLATPIVFVGIAYIALLRFAPETSWLIVFPIALAALLVFLPIPLTNFAAKVLEDGGLL